LRGTVDEVEACGLGTNVSLREGGLVQPGKLAKTISLQRILGIHDNKRVAAPEGARVS
jgi:hypothetical protein